MLIKKALFAIFVDRLNKNKEATIKKSGTNEILGDVPKISELFPEVAGDDYSKVDGSEAEINDIIDYKKALAGCLDNIKEQANKLSSGVPQIQFESREIQKDHTIDNMAYFLALNPQIAAIMACACPDGMEISAKAKGQEANFGSKAKNFGNAAASVLVGTGYGIVGTVMTLTPPAIAGFLVYEGTALALGSTSLVSTTVTLLGATMPAIIPIAALAAVIAAVVVLKLRSDEKDKDII